MAGYSGTSLPKKLGIKEGQVVALLGPPANFAQTLGELPAGVKLQRKIPARGSPDIIVWFVSRRADFEGGLNSVRQRMAPSTGVWVAWPKQASGVETDMTDNAIREVALPTGLVDNKVCAIDETWSGLRLVIRLENR
ncbi:MAG: DUF3052 family protein [Myxococcaceae bacterium]